MIEHHNLPCFTSRTLGLSLIPSAWRLQVSFSSPLIRAVTVKQFGAPAFLSPLLHPHSSDVEQEHVRNITVFKRLAEHSIRSSLPLDQTLRLDLSTSEPRRVLENNNNNNNNVKNTTEFGFRNENVCERK